MARRYADELGELRATYSAMRDLDVSALEHIARIQAEFHRRDAYFVGSGGAIAMAQIAASVHARRSRHVARAGTPLSLAMGSTLRVSNAAVGLFSVRARHPDVRLAARASRAQPGNRVVLLTQLLAADVDPRLAGIVDEIVVLPKTTRDGFLATNSVVGMATSWLRAAQFDLPDTLPMLEASMPAWPSGVTRVLVLYGPDQLAAAYDLEARLSETGLLDVQLADLRNLAHGRHVGLLQRAASTVVVALGDPSSEALVRKTLGALPETLKTVDLSTQLEAPVGTLDAMVGSMRLVGAIAGRSSVDPGQPKVSALGRRLYHLPWTQLAAGPDNFRPARVKAHATGMADASGPDLRAWSEAWDTWRARVSGRRVEAVVLDYDGTCVPTAHRTLPPPPAVQAEMSRLLESGVRIGIASGRGPSILDELRRWLPKEHWKRVLVGIYNGSVINSLDCDVERGTCASDRLLDATEVLRSGLVGAGWSISARRWQITVERTGNAVADAAAAVHALVEPEFGSELKIIESGHSVDIVPRETSKRLVVDRLGAELDAVMLIGDRGGIGGNDFELLSYSDLSLSVDQVSADPTRCWNLSLDGANGPEMLAGYLGNLKRSGDGRRVSWRPTPRGRRR